MAALTLVVLKTTMIDQAKRFYETLLGTEFMRERHGEGPEHYSAVLDGDVILEIYLGFKCPTPVGFRVDDLEGTLLRIRPLLAKDPEVARRGGKAVSAVVRDPEDRRVELTAE